MPRIEYDLDRNSLYHLGKVPGRVVGRQQRELRAAGWGDLGHLAMEDSSGEGIDADVCRVSPAHVGKLRLLIVGFDPNIAPNQVNDLHSGRYQLALTYMAFPNRARRGRNDAGIAQVHFGDNNCRLFGLDICLI
jgi:hypothetical protein